MTPTSLVNDHRNNVRQFWAAFVKVQGSLKLIDVTPAEEMATYFYDGQTPREGLDLAAEEFAAANIALASLSVAGETELPKLRKLL